MQNTSRESERNMRGPSRMEAFSDGVFSIAITLLIIEIVGILHFKQEEGLIDLLLHNWEALFAFLVGFLTILVCWINHHLVFNYVREIDSNLMWVNAFVLLMVSFAPFPTAVLAEYFDAEKTNALAFFGFNYFMIALAAFCLSYYVYRKHLIDASSRELMRKLIAIYKYSIIYTLVAFGVCFISVIAAICMYIILFVVFAFPKEWAKRLKVM